MFRLLHFSMFLVAIVTASFLLGAYRTNSDDSIDTSQQQQENVVEKVREEWIPGPDFTKVSLKRWFTWQEEESAYRRFTKLEGNVYYGEFYEVAFKFEPWHEVSVFLLLDDLGGDCRLDRAEFRHKSRPEGEFDITTVILPDSWNAAIKGTQRDNLENKAKEMDALFAFNDFLEAQYYLHQFCNKLRGDKYSNIKSGGGAPAIF